MTQTRAALTRHMNPVSYTIVGLLLLFILPTFVFKHLWIDLKEVHIDDVRVGEVIWVDVDRTIHRDFEGDFDVVIRDAGEGFVCLSAPKRPFPYAHDAPSTLRETLTWWLGGDEQMENCVSRGFGKAGTYSITTCHHVIGPYRIRIGRRCVDSNYFTIFP